MGVASRVTLLSAVIGCAGSVSRVDGLDATTTQDSETHLADTLAEVSSAEVDASLMACPGSATPSAITRPIDEGWCSSLAMRDECELWARLPRAVPDGRTRFLGLCADIGDRTTCVSATRCDATRTLAGCRCGEGPACAPSESCAVTHDDPRPRCVCRDRVTP